MKKIFLNSFFVFSFCFLLFSPFIARADCETGQVKVPQDSCVDEYGNIACSSFLADGSCCCSVGTKSETKSKGRDSFFNCQDKGIGAMECFVTEAYTFSLGLIGALAFLIIVVGGILYMTSGGNPNRIGTAKKLIWGAVSGVALLLVAGIIVKLIEDIFGQGL